MKCTKLFAMIMAIILLFASVAPVAATDGRRSEFIYINPGRHPWQDDTQNGGNTSAAKVIVVAIGPFVSTVKIPVAFFSKKESRLGQLKEQAPTKKEGGNK